MENQITTGEKTEGAQPTARLEEMKGGVGVVVRPRGGGRSGAEERTFWPPALRLSDRRERLEAHFDMAKSKSAHRATTSPGRTVTHASSGEACNFRAIEGSRHDAESE